MRGYRVAGPFTRYALHLSLSGCITGTTALLQNSPQLLLLGAVLPHKMRVRNPDAYRRPSKHAGLYEHETPCLVCKRILWALRYAHMHE